MTPEAFKVPTGDPRVPRDYFEIALGAVPAYYPAFITNEQYAIIQWKMPANWQGFDRFRLWVEGSAIDATHNLDITVWSATCTELNSLHNENHAITCVTAVSVYTCIDLMTTFATILALMADCDLIRIQVQNTDVTSITILGLEVVES